MDDDVTTESVTVPQLLAYLVTELRGVRAEIANANESRDRWALEIYSLLAGAKKGSEMSDVDNPQQHPLDEKCFYCAPAEDLIRGLQLMDDGKPWDGPTIHMQTSRAFCPVIEQDSEPEDERAQGETTEDPE